MNLFTSEILMGITGYVVSKTQKLVFAHEDSLESCRSAN